MTFKSPRQLTNRLETAYLPTSDLRPMPGAPREHPKSQIRALSKSFQAFGQVLPILIDRENRIVSGHAQWETAHRLQMEEVMVVRVDHLSEVQCKALMVALKRLGDLSKWNDLALGTILLDLQTADLAFDIEATGFTEIEIELRVEGLEAPAPEDEAPILVGEGPSVIQPGDLWLLGAHRLLCGDALNSDTWTQLMAGERAALVVTDPPFNVPIDGHVSGGGRHRHREFAQASGEMSAEAFTAFLQEAMTLACQWSADGALGYWAMDWRHVVEIGTAGLAAYDRFINMAVWAKNQPGMGSFYRSQHELFFVFAKGGCALPKQRPAGSLRPVAVQCLVLSVGGEPRPHGRRGKSPRHASHGQAPGVDLRHSARRQRPGRPCRRSVRRIRNHPDRGREARPPGASSGDRFRLLRRDPDSLAEVDGRDSPPCKGWGCVRRCGSGRLREGR